MSAPTSTTRASSEPSASADPVGSIEKAIDVLFHLHTQEAPVGVTAIGRALGIPKSSVHRIISALSHRGLVERDERGRYRTGVGLVALGARVLERDPVVVAARPALERAARELGETFFCVGERGGQLVVLDKAEGRGFLRAAPEIGASVPAHATAVGKLYAAFAPEALPGLTSENDADGPRHAFTRHTIVSDAALARSVEDVRALGFAVNRDEWIDGLSVLAAPVWLDGRLVAAVAMAAASARFHAIGDDVVEQAVLAATADVDTALSGGERANPPGDGRPRS